MGETGLRGRRVQFATLVGFTHESMLASVSRANHHRTRKRRRNSWFKFVNYFFFFQLRRKRIGGWQTGPFRPCWPSPSYICIYYQVTGRRSSAVAENDGNLHPSETRGGKKLATVVSVGCVIFWVSAANGARRTARPLRERELKKNITTGKKKKKRLPAESQAEWDL